MPVNSPNYLFNDLECIRRTGGPEYIQRSVISRRANALWDLMCILCSSQQGCGPTYRFEDSSPIQEELLRIVGFDLQ